MTLLFSVIILNNHVNNSQMADLRSLVLIQEKLIEVLNFISQAQCSDEQKHLMLEMAANTVTVSKLGSLISPDNETQETIKTRSESLNSQIRRF